MISDLSRRTSRAFLLILFGLCVSCAVASPRSDAWKLRRSNPVAAEQQLQTVVRQNPKDAKAWWFLTLVQKDLGRAPDALRSLETAKRIDPKLSFSSPESVGKIELSLRRAIAKSGKGSTVEFDRTPSNRNAQPPRNSSNTNASAAILRAFKETGVYIAPEMTGRADRAKIETAARDSSLQIRVAVIGALPPRARSVGQVAQVLHKQWNLDDGLMIVVSDRPRALGIYGAGFDKPTLDDIAARTAKTFDSEGYAEGIARVVSLAGEEKSGRDAAGRNLLLLIFGVPTALVLWSVRRGKKRGAQNTSAARSSSEAEMTRVQSEWKILSSDLRNALSAELAPARRAQLQEAGNRAAEACRAASAKHNEATRAQDFDAARVALRTAETEMQRAREVLSIAIGATASGATPTGATPTGATSNAGVWADGDYEIPPLGENLPGARPGYALDFFTSEPVLRSQMIPVEIELGGRRRRVWASPQSAARSSQDPQIATSNDQAGSRAWFDTPSYNPWTNFGAQTLQMVAMQTVFSAMAGGHGGYHAGYNSGFDSHSGGQGTNDQADAAASPYDSDEPIEAGEASLDSPLVGENWDAPTTGNFNSSFAESSGGFSSTSLGDSS